MNIENIRAEIGNFIAPDEWKIGAALESGNFASFELPSSNIADIKYPVNVKVSGRTVNYSNYGKRVRVQIEFVKDGEESTFSGGWMTI